MALSYEYSKNWMDVDSLLIYTDPKFKYNKKLIIVPLENGLIENISTNKLNHTLKPIMMKQHNPQFIEIIKRETHISVVIIANVTPSNKTNIDVLKRKVELFSMYHKIPILGLFPMAHNKLSKPHTGPWKLLRVLYQKYGYNIEKACVVSDHGGRYVTKQSKTGKSQGLSIDNSDIDRAFAFNIGVPFMTIKEYINADIDPVGVEIVEEISIPVTENGLAIKSKSGEIIVKKERFSWNNNCLTAEQRLNYIRELNNQDNPDIYEELKSLGPTDKYLIMIYGPPRCGKTTLANKIIDEWKKNPISDKYMLKYISNHNSTMASAIKSAKKALTNYMSALIDCNTFTTKLRKPFEKLAEEHNAKILHIHINMSINFAFVLNHMAVETAKDVNIKIIEPKVYYIYRSLVSHPENSIDYHPTIKSTDKIINFKY